MEIFSSKNDRRRWLLNRNDTNKGICAVFTYSSKYEPLDKLQSNLVMII